MPAFSDWIFEDILNNDMDVYKRVSTDITNIGYETYKYAIAYTIQEISAWVDKYLATPGANKTLLTELKHMNFKAMFKAANHNKLFSLLKDTTDDRFMSALLDLHTHLLSTVAPPKALACYIRMQILGMCDVGLVGTYKSDEDDQSLASITDVFVAFNQVHALWLLFPLSLVLDEKI